MSAEKHLTAGETISEGVATWIGPGFLPEINHYSHPICLGCYTFVDGNYACERCNWYLCSRKCMDEPWHKNFECPILTENKIEPKVTNLVAEYESISILRAILLMINYPEEFAKIKPKIEHRSAEINSAEMYTLIRWDNFAREFEKKYFLKQGSVDSWILAGIRSTIRVDGIFLNLPRSRVCTALYAEMLPIGYSCVPNCRYNHYAPNDERSEFKVELYSLQDIPKGGSLYRALDENILLDGTFRRRSALREMYEYNCTCDRCSDPTELGTFLSAAKCRITKCRKAGGLLLPILPLENGMNGEWKCTKCEFRSTRQEILEYVDSVMDEIIRDSLVRTPGLPPIVALVQSTENILEQSLDILHENHYLLRSRRTDLIRLINTALWSIFPVPRIRYAKMLSNQTHYLIQTLHAILPGISPIKAKHYYEIAMNVRVDLYPELEESLGTKSVKETMKRWALLPLKKLESATPPARFGDVAEMVQLLERWVGSGPATGLRLGTGPNFEQGSNQVATPACGYLKWVNWGDAGVNFGSENTDGSKQSESSTDCRSGTKHLSGSNRGNQSRPSCSSAVNSRSGRNRGKVGQNKNDLTGKVGDEDLESIANAVQMIQVSGTGKQPRKRRVRKRLQAELADSDISKN